MRAPEPVWLMSFRGEQEWKRRWRRELVNRICRTDSGLAFYFRVKAL